ncbi:MAG: hypothetical protein RBS17_02060 [Coriobacteriia bacterium]|nr:hypothetical protein [Coriobacteriia bacterium]
MKRWTLMIVAMASAFALIATPALAADQVRSQTQTQTQDKLQDGTCGDCDQLQLRTGDQTQTRLQECDPVQARTQTKAQVQTQDCDPAQTQAQTQTKTATQLQARTQTQIGESDATDTSEWAQKVVRFQKKHSKQHAKCAHIITSSD